MEAVDATPAPSFMDRDAAAVADVAAVACLGWGGWDGMTHRRSV